MKKLENKYINNDESELAALEKVWETGEYAGTSRFVQVYEKDLEEYFQTPYISAVSSGTDAIEVAMRALDLSAGDEVMLPSYAPVMSVLPLIHLGIRPVFIDSEPQTFNIDLDDVRGKISDRTRAILAVPMWGYPIQMDTLRTFCDENGFFLLEDAAHCHGSKLGARFVGTLSDVGVFSTQERKLVATGEGGIVVASNQKIYEKVNSIRDFGKVQSGDIDYPQNVGEYGFYDGSNFRITGTSAAIGSVQVKKLEAKIAARTANAQHILSGIADLEQYDEIHNVDDTRNNYYSLVLRLTGINSRELGFFLEKRNIISDTYRFKIKPLYNMPFFGRYLLPCENTEELLSSIITVPTHEGLTTDDIERILRSLREFTESTS